MRCKLAVFENVVREDGQKMSHKHVVECDGEIVEKQEDPTHEIYGYYCTKCGVKYYRRNHHEL